MTLLHPCHETVGTLFSMPIGINGMDKSRHSHYRLGRVRGARRDIALAPSGARAEDAHNGTAGLTEPRRSSQPSGASWVRLRRWLNINLWWCAMNSNRNGLMLLFTIGIRAI